MTTLNFFSRCFTSEQVQLHIKCDINYTNEYRFAAEIVEDLPTVYEMPIEASKWVSSMIKYTVDGGKMNRGLATVSVCKTIFESKGWNLTDKVQYFVMLVCWFACMPCIVLYC
jgi:hypothetical protein